MRPQFVVQEVLNGLKRNLTMTLAVVVTVGVSLSLFGSALLVRAQVGQMKDYWYDRVEVSIFLCGANSTAPSCALGAVTPEVRAQIEAEDPKVRRFVMQVLRERQRIGHRRVVHPAPKPGPKAKRRRGREMQECPQCGGTGPMECPVCGGDGWIAQE